MFFPGLQQDDKLVDRPGYGTIKLYHGDCRQVLKRLPANSVHCVVTSPPYFGLRNYGHDKQIGLEPSPDEYVAAMVDTFREVRRVLRDDGTVWLNIGDSYSGYHGNKNHVIPTSSRYGYNENMRSSAIGHGGIKPKDLIGIPWMTAFALRSDGWYLRQDNIWAKRNCTPESTKDRTTRAHEYVFQLTKSQHYFYDYTAIEEQGDIPAGTMAAKGSDERRKHANGRPPEYAVYTGKRNKRSVWRIAAEPFDGTHYAAFPRELPAICIKAGTSAVGCCPKCGNPYVRQVEPTERYAANLGNDWYDFSVPGSRQTHGKNQKANPINKAKGPRVGYRETVTTGWLASCTCEAGEPVPCTVLDPFGGAGTTGIVASELGRDAVLIELSDEYIQVIRNRCSMYPLQLQKGMQRRPIGIAP